MDSEPQCVLRGKTQNHTTINELTIVRKCKFERVKLEFCHSACDYGS